MISPPIPPQATTAAALDAALRSLHDTGCGCGGEYHPPHDGETARLKAALEAARPHLAAAERERCAQLAETAKRVVENAYGTHPRHTRARDGGCRDDCRPCGIEALRDALLRQEGGGT